MGLNKSLILILRGIYMFFSTMHSYKIIDNKVTDDNLQKFCKEHDIQFFDDDAGLWFAFANLYGFENGLTEVERLSFGRMVSYFFTEVTISCGTEEFFKEEQIELELLNILKKLSRSGKSELEVAKEFFFAMFDFYNTKSDLYGIKTETLVVRMPLSMLERFMEVDGGSKSEKLRNLLSKR